MVTGRSPLAALALGSWLLGACLDVRQTDPGPCRSFRLDDFEDGDLVPSMKQFGAWRCGALDERPPSADCVLEEVSAGGHALVTPSNPSATTLDIGIPRASTVVNGAPIDLRVFADLALAVRRDGGRPALSNTTVVSVELGCAAAPVERPADPMYVSLTQPILISSPGLWATVSLPMADFVQPASQTNRFVGGAPACLRRVDSVIVNVPPPTDDGLAAGGVLHLDDLVFGEACAE